MNTFRRILREFWVPAIVAAAWTAYNFWTRTGQWHLKEIVNVFGPSFFLASWITGQFFRIRKQASVDQNLTTIEQRLTGVVDSLEARTSELMSTITGGESFCVLQFIAHDLSRNVGQIVAVHHGAHPLYEVRARIVDGDCFQKAVSSNQPITPDTCSTVVSIGAMVPKHAVMLGVIQLGQTSKLGVTVTARNGSFSQIIRLSRTASGWTEASRVERDGKVLYERIAEDFPRELLAGETWPSAKTPAA